MPIAKWTPFGDLINLRDRINRLFDDEFERDADEPASITSWHPTTDIYETKTEFVFKLEMPGMKKEDINIQIHDEKLIISGEKKENREILKENYHRIESYSGSFKRSFKIPSDIDPQKIDASIKEGILTLKIGKIKKKPAKSIKISIK